MSVWIVAGLLSLAGALTYAELASRMPRSGGEYAYLRVTIGELPAFLFGWMRLTVGAGTVGGLAIAVTVFLSDLVSLGPAWWQVAVPWGTQPVVVDLGPRQLIAVLVIAGLATLNIRGVGNAGRFQTWVTLIKVLGLVGLISAIVLIGHANAAHVAQMAVVPPSPGILAYSAATLAALVAYAGWANLAMLGGEIQEPRRNLPWALIVGTLIVIGLYVAANAAYLHVLSADEILSANSSAHPNASSIASRAAIDTLGSKAGHWLPALFLISALGTLHCNLMAVPRIFFSMARDGLLPRSLGRVAENARTPFVAIAVYAGFGAVLAAMGSYDRLTNMATFGTLLFFGLNALGFLRWRYFGPARPARPAQGRQLPAVIPLAFLFGILYLIVTLILRGSVEVIAALALLAMGVPVFLLTRFFRGPKASSPH
jgi:APA family basic amino acid/polyamine antiporter